MRKNLIPLLAIALVIAGLCTVIFYGLIADRFGPAAPAGAQAAPTALVVAAKTIERGKVLEAVDLRAAEGICPVKAANACFPSTTPLLGRTTLDTVVEGQPLLEELVATRAAGAGPSAAIPVGMRAVTLHAADSSGVVKMIRSGDRIDLQVIGSDDPQSLRLYIQKVWTNIEVLHSQGPDAGSSHAGRPVLTVLFPPADAERLSLADTTSRIRVVLRNRQDTPARPVPAEPAVNTPAAARVVRQGLPAPPAGAPPEVAATRQPGFLVRLVSVHPKELIGLGGSAADLQPEIHSVSGQTLEQTLARLEQDKSAHVLGSRSFSVGQRETSLALGADGESLGVLPPGVPGVRLRLQALTGDRWRIEPEAQAGGRGAAAARRAESDVAFHQNQAWLVGGLLEHKEGRPVLPGQGGEHEPRLVLLITPVPLPGRP